ncbi:MAG: hypothetical protein CFE24_06980 [Flavobacterium sp. BFFFF2]|nr:MAG: hypothetical protein CFE24_06980 [Flavobacterium sp. BFFFF2]
MKQLCSFSLLAQRKRTKRKGFFGPHKRSFLPAAKPVSLGLKSLQGFRIFTASETYDYICGPALAKLRTKINIVRLCF